MALRLVTHPVIDQYKGGHGLDDWHGTWHDARVMTPAAHELGFVTAGIDGALILNQCSSGLEGDSEDEFFAVADATLDATGTVGFGADFTVFVDEDVVVLGAKLH